MRQPILQILSLLLLLFTPLHFLCSDELAIFEPYHLAGHKDGIAFSGQCEILQDATYTLARTINDETWVETGLAAIVIQQLRLAPQQNTYPGYSSEPRYYDIQYADGRVTWIYENGAGDQETLIQAETEEETTLQLFARVLSSPGLDNYLVNRNFGLLDPAVGREIYRSNRPSPNELAHYQRKYGIKTLLSLNGDQNKVFREGIRTRKSAGRVQARFRGPPVNLKDKIQQLGINHVVLSMGSTRAPTDEQLVQAFEVLTNDAMKPILMHCHAGADRTGIIGAIYRMEYMGWDKEAAKAEMRSYMWSAFRGTEIQGAYLDLYQLGYLQDLLQ